MKYRKWGEMPQFLHSQSFFLYFHPAPDAQISFSRVPFPCDHIVSSRLTPQDNTSNIPSILLA
jgi:hypothetical protein